MKETLQTGVLDEHEQKEERFAIDALTAEFSQSVSFVAHSPEKMHEMQDLLKQYNPMYEPVEIETWCEEAKVLAEVVAGIYAPLIHGYTKTIVENVASGTLPPVVVAPPRDAIPLAVSLEKQAHFCGVDLTILYPHVNRNTAGIKNNQKEGAVERSPLLDAHIEQVAGEINGSWGAVEVETGIYGTTSLVMAEEFKNHEVGAYIPTKFFALGPNMSYVHAVLSGGEWVAEEANVNGLLNYAMILVDTMEELGMEKVHKSVETLCEGEDGVIVPEIVPVSPVEAEIARVTHEAIRVTASRYCDQETTDVVQLMNNLPWLVEQSRKGFPFTLTAAIPPMDSKEEHYQRIRESGLFDQPKLAL